MLPFDQSAKDGRFQNLFTPLFEIGRAGVVGRPRFGIVEALILGSCHVGHSLRHSLGHPEIDEPTLVGLEWDLLVAHPFAQYLRNDFRHVVEGQVLGAKNRNMLLSARSR